LTGFIESLYILTRLNVRLEVDMKVTSDRLRDNLFVAFVLVSFLFALSGWAADHPAPNQGEWIVRDFRFHTGEVLPELRLHYTTVGAPSGEPVLILHGSTGAGTNMLNANFAGELFGPGQPLDVSRYFIILPDALGAGKSSKPSDGLRTRFPKYNYDDIVPGVSERGSGLAMPQLK
jgi:homoserine O-acetyltransferase